MLSKPLLVNKDDRKKLEVRFSDGSDTTISLRLEGSRLEKYGMVLANLLPLMLAQGALNQELLAFLPSEKPGKKLDEGNRMFEVLHRQGENLNNILKVIREFRNMDFSSKDVKKRYEERLGKPIQLSTVATYLMRLHDKGLLLRRKMGKEYVYQAAALLLKNE
ncbi:MAG: BlaI/MecI/CopY family transcriptional regulator [Thermoproteota archaeon]